ncbi:MAG: type IV secretion system protein [Desulfovibrionaceae bacterium]|nr:type IV secretion system protein [Desulfovibrionaceae bacterium]
MLWKSKPAPEQPKERSPYVDARAEWLERYGSYIQRARRAWLVSLVALGVAAFSVVGNVIQASQYHVVPYVVEIDRQGNAAAVGRADKALPISPRLIQAELGNIVTHWRTVTVDLDLQKRFVDRLSHFVTGAARGQLKQWYEANNPYERAKTSLVQISITALPAPVSADSWRVEWVEVTRNHTGIQLSSDAYQATLTISIQPAATEAEILKNPGGVYITNISFSKVIGPAAASSQKQETR